MQRLCERPGCSEPGAIGFGFDADRLLVWLTRREALAADDVHRAGVLCRRHADAMVVPVGWTLDDRREVTPRLFRPTSPASARPGRRRRLTPTTPRPNVAAAMATAALPLDPVVDEPEAPTVAEVTGAPSTADDPDATVAMPWVPDFDVEDDLGGLLHAESPLLARAFRGLDRPR